MEAKRLLRLFALLGSFTLTQGATLTLLARGQWVTALGAGLLALLSARGLVPLWPEVLATRSAALLARARQAGEREQWARSLRLTQAALAWAPRDTWHREDTLAHLAWLLTREGRGAEALRILAQLPTPPPLTKAEAHLQVGQSTLALALAERVHAERPRPHAAHCVVEALLQLRRLDEALAFLGHQENAHVCVEALSAARRAAHAAGRLDEAHALGLRAAGPPSPPGCSQRPGGRALPPGDVLPSRPWAELPCMDFVAHWTLTTLVGVLAGGLAQEAPRLLGDESPSAWMLFLLGTLGGGLLGLAQGWMLRRVLPGTGPWLAFTALGSGLGLFAFTHPYVYADWLTMGLYERFGLFLTFASVQQAVAAAWQALLLGRWFPRVASWPSWTLLAGVLGELAVSGLWSRLAPLLSTLRLEQGTRATASLALLLALRGLFIGALTGLVLHRWLAARRSLPGDGTRAAHPTPNRDRLPQEIPILPICDSVLFPGVVRCVLMRNLPIALLADLYLKDSFRGGPLLGVVTQRASGDLPAVGVLARLVGFLREDLEDKRIQLRFHALARIRLTGFVPGHSAPLRARYEFLEEPTPTVLPEELDELRQQVALTLRPHALPADTLSEFLSETNPVLLTDVLMAYLEAPLEEKQAMLEEPRWAARRKALRRWLDAAPGLE